MIANTNNGEYADKLGAGHKALFKLYPDYKMKEFHSHRNVGYPAQILVRMPVFRIYQRMNDQHQPKPADESPTLWQVVKSVAAAFFGVQNRANRVRDFTHGKPHQFIIIGVVMTALFVLTLVAVVKIVLSSTGVSG